MCDNVSPVFLCADFPHLTAGNFESCLASDHDLVNSFNDFLRLPCFSEAVQYNQGSGLFELETGAAESVSRTIGTVLREVQADPAVLAKTPPVDNHYTVFHLDEQGTQWIKREKLPFYLQSDCYFEYRLDKFLFQQKLELSKCRSKSSSRRGVRSRPASPRPDVSLCHLKCEQSQDLHSSQTDLSLSVMGASTASHEDQHLRPSQGECCQMFGSAEQQPGYLDAVSMVGGLHLVNTNDSVNKSGHQEEANTDLNEKNKGSRVRNQENSPDFCRDDRPDFNAFKEFLQGRQGAKLLGLWMDVERLKAAQHRGRKKRYLELMTRRYVPSSSSSSLSAGQLSSLGLAASPCWTEERLLSVQPLITHDLLSYWGNQFWMSPRVGEDGAAHVGLQTVEDCYGITPSVLQPTPQRPHSAPTELLSSRVRSLCSRNTQKMLDVLFVESHSGSYFTHFCELSGNQLWVNTVYLWADLQHYHELFEQEELNPYTVQREAQLLYSTYISSFARRSVEVDEQLRVQVYSRLFPAAEEFVMYVYDRLLPVFEELFDRVEEHVLKLLLEPWMLLVSRDRESFQQVCVQEEVRCVDTQEFRELQSLYEELGRQLQQQMEESQRSAQANALDSSVSSRYQNDLLEAVLGQSGKTGHFLSFLQSHGASLHLRCWADLEQYRRTPHTDRTARQQRSSCVVTKYLNERYFFGADSPATAEQQDDVLCSTGGRERLASECLSDSVVVEIQGIIRTHIEETLLPWFRSKSKPKSKLQARGSFWQKLASKASKASKAKKEAGKESLWMASSKEILLFRQLLLDPVACQQFQHFVSLRGDFLENDVRFWVEVQRYKDLYHSHCDDDTIQHKISTIIGCFIDSSAPPPLQIDVPPEQAQRILEKRHELGPYIFREAQTSVFGELLQYWTEFQRFSSKVQEKDILPLLQEKREKYRARVRRQKRKEEEDMWRSEQKQEKLERQESQFTDGGRTDDGEEMKQKETPVKARARTRRRAPPNPPPLLQSLSKYMAGLKKEQILLKKQIQLATLSSSTVSEPASDISIKSARSKRSTVHP